MKVNKVKKIWNPKFKSIVDFLNTYVEPDSLISITNIKEKDNYVHELLKNDYMLAYLKNHIWFFYTFDIITTHIIERASEENIEIYLESIGKSWSFAYKYITKERLLNLLCTYNVTDLMISDMYLYINTTINIDIKPSILMNNFN
jgi:hypothetical protein